MTNGVSSLDETHMRAALAEARKGLGRTSPNPAVGCVIVRDGKVVAAGHHRQAGMPHAEIEALRALEASGASAEGASLYVNLEPCNHQGRTGPCTEAIVAAKVGEVVFGMTDPNPLVNGSGAARLREAGIRVRSGILEAECRRVNEAFTRWITAGRPHVTLKAAVTLDGRIAGVAGAPRWITGEEARAAVHRLRDAVDAVLVGANTVLRDDPQLTTRLPSGGGRTGRRVVLDGRARVPATARVLAAVKETPRATVFVADDAPADRIAALEKAGAEVVRASRADGAGIDLAAALAVLAKSGVMSVLVEGGSEVFTSFLRARAVDRVIVFVAPKFMGGDGTSLVGALGGGFTLADVGIERFGDDVMFEGVPDWSAA